MRQKSLPRKFLIGDVPYFSSEFYPYYCTEASTQMIWHYFCKKRKLRQDEIEKMGARTYEGEKEEGDIGAFRFFISKGFNVLKEDNPSIKRLKEMMFKYRAPAMVRLLSRKTGWNHTVVAVGFNGSKIIAHDPDTMPFDEIPISPFEFKMTSFLIPIESNGC